MYYSNEKNLIKAENGFYDFKQSIGLAHLLNPGWKFTPYSNSSTLCWSPGGSVDGLSADTSFLLIAIFTLQDVSNFPRTRLL